LRSIASIIQPQTDIKFVATFFIVIWFECVEAQGACSQKIARADSGTFVVTRLAD
jgi:hypothetical protein